MVDNLVKRKLWFNGPLTFTESHILYNCIKKLEKIEQILKARSFTDDIGNACYLDNSERIGRIKEVLEQE